MTRDEPIYIVKKEPYGKHNEKQHFVCPCCKTFLDEPTVIYKMPQCPVCNKRLKWPKKTNGKINTNYRISEKTNKILSIIIIITGATLLALLFFVKFYIIK